MLALWILIFVSTAKAEAQNPRKVVYTATLKIEVYHEKRNWRGAKDSCENREATLVKINSTEVAEALNLELHASNDYHYWIGANDHDQEGVWVWLDGTNAGREGGTYHNWKDGEPNDYLFSSEDCAEMDASTSKWNDESCSTKYYYICQRDIPVRITSVPYQFTFYVTTGYGLKSDYRLAQDTCRKYNSRLVEIKSEDMVDAINQELDRSVKDEKYWIGANDIATEGHWKWNNGSDVVFSKWTSNQAQENSTNRDCAAIWKSQWHQFDCSESFYFICETERVNGMSITPARDFSGTIHKLTCSVVGYPIPEITWRRNNTTAFTSSYEVINSSMARADILIKTLLDEGVYRCLATNSIHNTTYSISQTYSVKVPSEPTIVKVESNGCNSVILFHWIPNRRAVNIRHRINTWNDVDTNTVYIIPKGEIIENQLETANSSTFYNISVTPCGEMCFEEYTASTTAISGGIPRAPEHLNVSFVGDLTCSLAWDRPNTTAKHIASYKITAVSTINEVATDSLQTYQHTEGVSVGNITKYSFSGLANRKYLFKVQAKTCAGLGQYAEGEGQCITGIQAPAELHKAEVVGTVNENKVTIKIRSPDQKNGPISCLFVVVLSGEASGSQTFGLSDLNKANDSKSTHAESEYISVALVVSRLTAPSTSIVIGDSSSTSCDIYSTNKRNERSAAPTKSSFFVGQNTPLDPDKLYSMYTVSTTPSGGKILFQTSKVQALEYPDFSSSIAGIVISIIGALLVAAFVLLLLWRRRRAKLNRHLKETEIDLGPLNNDDNRRGTEIPMGDFEEIYKSMLQNDETRFREQFQKLIQEARKNGGETAFASKPEFKKMNRYKNILPFDTTRVRIEHSESGYINACFINGFHYEGKFIATQGPLPSTVKDFWLMVVEKRCAVIVMLAKCVESGKKKCEKYWPLIMEPRRSSESFLLLTQRK